MSQEPDRLNSFLQDYEHYVSYILKPAQLEIRDALEPWRNPNHWRKYKATNRISIPTPVRAILSRIKRPEQVVDKIFRKSQEFPGGLVPASFQGMRDALGVRITVYFLSHLPLVDREIRSSGLFDVSEEEPPAAYIGQDEAERLSLDHLDATVKESGYRSIHYCLRVRNSRLPDEERPWIEMQVRTLAMDLWSTMEHHLGYKPGKGTSMAAKRQFRILSRMLGAIDEHFNLLYEELNHFQAHANYEDADLLSPGNLPPLLAEIGVVCYQRDVNNILKLLYSRGLETVAQLRRIATPNRLDIIRNTYLSVCGRLPTNLEVIATLATLAGAENREEEVDRIKAQIAYRGAWDSIRQEFARNGGVES